MLWQPALEMEQAPLSRCWVQAKAQGRQRPLMKGRRQLRAPRERGQGRPLPRGMALEQPLLKGWEMPQGLARRWRWGGPGACAAPRRRRRRQLQAAAAGQGGRDLSVLEVCSLAGGAGLEWTNDAHTARSLGPRRAPSARRSADSTPSHAIVCKWPVRMQAKEGQRHWMGAPAVLRRRSGAAGVPSCLPWRSNAAAAANRLHMDAICLDRMNRLDVAHYRTSWSRTAHGRCGC